MNTRRYRDAPDGNSGASRGSYLMSVKDKLSRCHIAIDTVVEKCRLFDENRDNIIHADDLIDVLFDLVPRNTFTKRELHHLIAALTHDTRKGNIAYLKLHEVLGDKSENAHHNRIGTELEEKWRDDSELVPEQQWAAQRGSVGEWLLTAGCPAERRSFRQLIDCLEVFERESGLRIEQTETGFVLPLGPNLRATLNFSMSK